MAESTVSDAVMVPVTAAEYESSGAASARLLEKYLFVDPCAMSSDVCSASSVLKRAVLKYRLLPSGTTDVLNGCQVLSPR